jgi:N-hydroxyarylamine O-acetyltransferase
MNGLFGWALREVGFDVMRVNGAVRRIERGDDAIGNHVVLLVELDETWIADVGFGDGMIEPIPLRAADIRQRGFRYRLEHLADGYWRFHNHEYGGAPSFDFATTTADESLFASRCEVLQTNPASPFVINLVCQRFVDGGYEVQLGRLAKRISPDGVETRLLHDAGELIDRLRTVFGLDVPEAATLWPKLGAATPIPSGR